MEELLRQLSEQPDSIATFTAEQVTEARAALAQFSSAVRAGDIEPDADAVAEARQIADALTARETELGEAQAAFDADLAALDAALGVETEPPAAVETDEGDQDGETGPVAETDDTDGDTEPAVEAEPEPVAAAAAPSRGAIANRVPERMRPAPVAPALIASAGSPGAGSPFADRNALGQAMMDAWRGRGEGEYTIASLDTHAARVAAGGLMLGDSTRENGRILEEVARRAAEQGNLVASGGFCQPGETTYGFFNVASAAGILQLPSVGAPRGKVTYPVSPSLGDFIGQSGIASVWTNSTDVSPGENTKPVLVIDCPDFAEAEVAAYPTRLQFGNFAARFYPEHVAHVEGLTMLAAERVINAAAITALTGQANVATPSTQAGGALVNFGTVIAAQAAEYRQTYGMDPTAPLDMIAPAWTPRVLWADAVARDSTVEYGDLRRRIRGMLDELDIRVQWVYDYQNLADGYFPETVDVMIMAPGTAVQLDGGELNLGIVRDSELNSTNDFQTFAEPFIGWAFPGHEIREVQDINVCPTGGTGERAAIACLTSS